MERRVYDLCDPQAYRSSAWCRLDDPHEKHHSTVKDACEVAEKLGVQNLLLYHTEDKNISHRKELYAEEGKQYFTGKLFIPDDLETIIL